MTPALPRPAVRGTDPMRRRLLGSAVAAAAFAPALLRAQDGKIVLGQSAPLTGPAGQLGTQYARGAALYLELVNARGGINGRRVELRTLDDGYDPKRAEANTDELLASSDVFALFGYLGTPTSLAAMPRAIEAKVPFFAPLTGAQGLREPVNRYVFHIRASYFDETAAIVRQATAVGLKKIAVFHQNDSYGQAGLDGVTRALQAMNLQVAATGKVERNSSDVAQAVKDIVPKAPETIVLISAYASCAAFIREARRAGYGGTFYNVSFVGTKALADALGRDARGVIISQVMPFPYAPVTAVSGEFLQAIEKGKVEVDPNYSSIEGFIAAKVFCEGLRRAPRGASREAVVDALEGLKSYDAGGFRLEFGPGKRMGSRFVEMTVLSDDGRPRR